MKNKQKRLRIKEKKQVDALNTLRSDNGKLAIEDVIPENALKNDEAKMSLIKLKNRKSCSQRKINLQSK